MATTISFLLCSHLVVGPISNYHDNESRQFQLVLNLYVVSPSTGENHMNGDNFIIKFHCATKFCQK